MIIAKILFFILVTILIFLSTLYMYDLSVRHREEDEEEDSIQ